MIQRATDCTETNNIPRNGKIQHVCNILYDLELSTGWIRVGPDTTIIEGDLFAVLGQKPV